MNNSLFFSSNSDLWETPISFFNLLNNEFGFTLDPCCTPDTAKCKKFFTPVQNGLVQDWSDEVVFCNPPYSRSNLNLWVKKCFDESFRARLICLLIPSRTDTIYFHKYLYKNPRCELRFIKGRLTFGLNGEFKHPAPFPSLLAIFRL